MKTKYFNVNYIEEVEDERQIDSFEKFSSNNKSKYHVKVEKKKNNKIKNPWRNKNKRFDKNDDEDYD